MRELGLSRDRGIKVVNLYIIILLAEVCSVFIRCRQSLQKFTVDPRDCL